MIEKCLALFYCKKIEKSVKMLYNNVRLKIYGGTK